MPPHRAFAGRSTFAGTRAGSPPHETQRNISRIPALTSRPTSRSTIGTASWPFQQRLLSGQHREHSPAPPCQHLRPWKVRKNSLIAMNGREAKCSPLKSVKLPGLRASGLRCTMPGARASSNPRLSLCRRSTGKHPKGSDGLAPAKSFPQYDPGMMPVCRVASSSVRHDPNEVRQRSERRLRRELFLDHSNKAPASRRHIGGGDPCRTRLQSPDAWQCA